MKNSTITTIAAALTVAAMVPSGAMPTARGRHVLAVSTACAREVPASSSPVSFAISLPLTHQQQLDQFVKDVNDPTSPTFGHYLTPKQFAASYGANQATHDAVVKDLRARGFAVTSTDTRTLIQVSAPSAVVEKTFHVHLRHYVTPNGRTFHSPSSAPALTNSLILAGASIVGLDTGPSAQPVVLKPTGTNSFGFNQDNGAGPGQIRLAYGLTGSNLTGAGQNVGLLELDDYDDSDITGYEQTFHLPATPIIRKQIQATSIGAGQAQVTTDIDILLGLVPSASHVVVYEVPQSGGTASFLTVLQAIANDTTYRCREISCGWTIGEDTATSGGNTFVNAENAVFLQMAAQGQAFFCASGNTGAAGNPANNVVQVTDPAAQPFVTAVGGTSITVGYDGLYTSETTWLDASDTTLSATGSGSGGGRSIVWPLPAYQQGIVSHAPAGEFSTSKRNVPDVSLAADPFTGYAVYVQGGFQQLGYTGAASAVWCAFWALVNQQRAAKFGPQLGFANPFLYRLGKGGNYAADFHDIADNSNNLFFHAATGYDVTTGWGSINSNLMNDLVNNQAGGAPNRLIIQNTSTHQLQFWQMSNTGMTSSSTVNLTPSATQRVVGVGVFNVPGQYDIVFQDTSSNAITIWHMSGSNVVAINTPTQVIASAWKAVGVGDFDGDGSPDILFQNNISRQLVYWLMKGYAVTVVAVATTPPTGWTVAGTADFNGDGNSDILLVKTTGTQNNLMVWHMNRTTVLNQAAISNAFGTGYTVNALSSLQGYANPDIIFQGGAQLVVWDMNDSTRTAALAMTSTVPAGWTVVGPK